jgi:hypothetical protein
MAFAVVLVGVLDALLPGQLGIPGDRLGLSGAVARLLDVHIVGDPGRIDRMSRWLCRLCA